MRHLRCPSLLLFAALALAAGHGQARAVPPPAVNAVVRIPSHGASATVIETGPGRTLLLGCAHAFRGADRQRPIQLDVPALESAPKKEAGIRLLDVDYQADLSLILLEDGPLPFVAPVAPANHKPGPNILSIGYDGMQWPAQALKATIISITSTTTYTRERPGHGRSGGALLDADKGWLIGVVQGYELQSEQRGMYVAHASILRFLKRQQPQPPPPAAAPRPIRCPT